MIFLVHRPISGDIVGMTNDELNEFTAVPDHRGLDITVEMAFSADFHDCKGERPDDDRSDRELMGEEVPLD